MCLFKKHQLKKTSVKDRKVYKILIHDVKNEVYQTPYEDEIVNIKTIHKAKIKNYLRYLYNLYINNIIDDGFIHAYTSLNEAKNAARDIISSNPNRIIKLFECKVPRYTPYFIGDDQEIAVKELIYIKRIKL